MEMLHIIEKLQTMIENAQGIPLTDKFVLDRAETLDLISELRMAIPANVMDADRITEDEARIRRSAQREASNIVKEAKAQKQQLIEANNITRKAQVEANKIVNKAKHESMQFKISSIDYVANMLTNIQDDLRKQILIIDDNKNELRDKKKATNNTAAVIFEES